jgi:hypothetical protein
MLPGLYFTMVIISFLASLTAYFQKDSKRYLRLFPLLLFVTIMVELCASWLHAHKKPTSILYNFFSCLEFLFYMYILREIIQSIRMKKIIFHTAWLYLFLGVTNILFIQKITSFNSITYAIGCLLISIFCFSYFFDLFQQTYSVNLTRQPAFWICAGLLFFYTCSFPIYGLVNFLSQDFITKNIQVLLILLNVFLYSSFTIAFLCRIRVRNSTS